MEVTKITPRDYVDAYVGLSRAGFQAICTLLDEGKTITEVATAFGITELVVEIVKTTKSYEHYETVARLETEREGLQSELETAIKEDAKLKPKPWHYAVAAVILAALGSLLVWGIVMLVGWIRGL